MSRFMEKTKLISTAAYSNSSRSLDGPPFDQVPGMVWILHILPNLDTDSP